MLELWETNGRRSRRRSKVKKELEQGISFCARYKILGFLKRVKGRLWYAWRCLIERETRRFGVIRAKTSRGSGESDGEYHTHEDGDEDIAQE
ncbi:hypothetical protein Taro_045522 [Colocasia esculenta]|uniref:Uncharacterized protein n=1 Tax=Colocasia esculenta TaxID=4460 RepID=A0A843WPP6_COLES|nr:hypothetical protein [Colocasia esculenta]